MDEDTDAKEEPSSEEGTMDVAELFKKLEDNLQQVSPSKQLTAAVPQPPLT